MIGEPTVLILDDERLQLLTVRTQLRSVGTLVEFTEASKALLYATSTALDAVVVDIRLTGQTMDGLEFMRALRLIDPDVSFIVRTADESEEVIDGAMELRAMRRFIKSRASSSELRRCALAAIAETAARRRHSRAASEVSTNRSKLHEALGTVDMAITAGSVYRGLTHSMRNDLSSLSTLATLIATAASANPLLEELAQKNERVVAKMIVAMDGVLDGPFGEHGESPPSSVNKIIAALRIHFAGATEWIGASKNVRLRTLPTDAMVDCAPVTLFNGLKHLIEFALVRIPVGEELVVTPSLIPPPSPGWRTRDQARVIVDAGIHLSRHQVVFNITGNIMDSAADEILDIASERTSASRTGNIVVCNHMLAVGRGALLVLCQAGRLLGIEAVLPIYL
jgi:DNA-binding NarL/FixJ family response regulator